MKDKIRALIQRFDHLRNSGVCSPTTRGLLDDAQSLLAELSTPPAADDVREAVARAIFHPHAFDAHRESWIRDAAAYPESALASTHRREMKTVDRFLAEFEVRPRGTVTDAEVEAPAPCGKGVPGTVPSWAGEDQIDPCDCVRPAGHEGPHACAHENPSDAVEAEREAQR